MILSKRLPALETDSKNGNKMVLDVWRSQSLQPTLVVPIFFSTPCLVPVQVCGHCLRHGTTWRFLPSGWWSNASKKSFVKSGKMKCKNHFQFLGLRIKMSDCRKVEVNFMKYKSFNISGSWFAFMIGNVNSCPNSTTLVFIWGTSEPWSPTHHSGTTCPFPNKHDNWKSIFSGRK